MEFPVLGGVMNDVMVYGFRTLFFLSAVLLMVIVLLQEGKGGGLASALGGQGAETFGVSSGGVNRVTLVLAGVFLVSALGHALTFQKGVTADLRKKAQNRPAPEKLEGIGGDPLPGDDQKPEEQKPADSKPAEQKPAEPKPADKPAEAPKAPETPAEKPAEAPK